MPEQNTDANEAEKTGFAVYDNTLLKFVSGVLSKADAEKAKRAGPKDHKLEVREV
jgi:hypothetical protein